MASAENNTFTVDTTPQTERMGDSLTPEEQDSLAVGEKIVAGINSLGRGQDNEALTRFLATIAQTLGPEAMMKYVNPTEAVSRLAAAQGIDVLNLIKTPEQMEQEKQMLMQQQAQQSLVDQTGQLAGTPLMDPSKNPDLANQASAVMEGMMSPQEQPPEQ